MAGCGVPKCAHVWVTGFVLLMGVMWAKVGGTASTQASIAAAAAVDGCR